MYLFFTILCLCVLQEELVSGSRIRVWVGEKGLNSIFPQTPIMSEPGIQPTASPPPMQSLHLDVLQLHRRNKTIQTIYIQGLDNETETPVILVWEVSWLNWTSLVASLH
ncbi:hypothetical protein AMECASPLE_013018 [Ameca splendens]|uniref:Uncharacterized protein n=1 Tax=Ameca splendens TaxID=208324 RepID=A0ABV0ZNK5_9TELE